MIDDNGLAIPESAENDECSHSFEPFKQGFVICVKCHQVREVERSTEVSGRGAPTQGADARPVAIYQARANGDDKWSDVLEGVYDSCHRLHSHKFETRIVHESLPSDCEPVGEIVTFGKDPEVKEVSWAKGKMPSVGTKLYATRDAAPSDAQARLDWLREYHCSPLSDEEIDKAIAASAPMEKT